jgi:hypothetical protein
MVAMTTAPSSTTKNLSHHTTSQTTTSRPPPPPPHHYRSTQLTLCLSTPMTEEETSDNMNPHTLIDTTPPTTPKDDTSSAVTVVVVQTDEKKQHFDDIYFMSNPVPYKVRILDALEYISDEYNQQMFDAHIVPWIQQQQQLQQDKPIQFLDLCSCFGNTTMATVYGMSYKDICANWVDEVACMTINNTRRFDCHITAVDVSDPAIQYGTTVGLYDTGLVCNLNDRSTIAFQQTVDAIRAADVCISTAALVYLELETIDALVSAFASTAHKEKGESTTDGYMMVNFLNPFAIEKSDETKRILLKHLDFVGSRATKHRRMSPLEQQNYPGEEWSLLELWVLRRRMTK